MKLLKLFIKNEIVEGRKLNAMGALALAAGLASSQDKYKEIDINGPKKNFFAKNAPVEEPKDVVVKKKAGKKPVEKTREEYSTDELHELVFDECEKNDVPVAFADAIIYVESRYRTNVTSPAGAMGIMQLMPDTAKGLGVDDAYDPHQAIPAGIKLLKQLLNRYNNDYELAAAAYNAGTENVRKAKGIPNFAETKQYVIDVMKRMDESGYTE